MGRVMGSYYEVEATRDIYKIKKIRDIIWKKKKRGILREKKKIVFFKSPIDLMLLL